MESLHYFTEKPESYPINLERHRDGLFRYSLRLTRNRDDAEDLTQETIIRASGGLKGLRNPNKILSWLCRIASNINADRYRRRDGSECPVSNLNCHIDGGDSDDELSADMDYLGPDRGKSYEVDLDGIIFLSDCLGGLKPEHRAVLELRAGEWKYGDISGLLGIPIGTVRSRLHTARNSLREVLIQEGYTNL